MEPLPDHIKRYIAEAPVCRIATVRPDGSPHVIPVCPVFDGEGTLHIDLGPKSASGVALQIEPRIAVLFDDYFDDWTRLRKVLLRCISRPVTGAEQAAAWERIRAKFPQYSIVGWEPRQTMELRIESWLQEGFAGA